MVGMGHTDFADSVYQQKFKVVVQTDKSQTQLHAPMSQGNHNGSLEIRLEAFKCQQARRAEQPFWQITAAYEEYARVDDYESATRLVHEFDNVIVTRTFSKVYGMAGLRLGWCYELKWAMELTTTIGPSFPVNCIAYAAGIASIKDTQHTRKVLDHNDRWTRTLIDEMTGLGLRAYPSQTNFVLVGFPPECGRSADETNRHLNSNGIIPRQFALPDFFDKLRFTVGTDDEMDKTIDVLKQFLTV